MKKMWDFRSKPPRQLPDYYVEWQKPMPEDKHRRMMEDLMSDPALRYVALILFGYVLAMLTLKCCA